MLNLQNKNKKRLSWNDYGQFITWKRVAWKCIFLKDSRHTQTQIAGFQNSSNTWNGRKLCLQADDLFALKMSNKNTNKTKEDYNNNKKENACLDVKDSNVVLTTSEMMQFIPASVPWNFFFITHLRSAPYRYEIFGSARNVMSVGQLKKEYFNFTTA